MIIGPDPNEVDFLNVNMHLERNRQQLIEMLPKYLHGLLDYMYRQDRGTYAHSIEAGAAMLSVLRELQETDPDITDEDIRTAVAGAVLHDLGKVLDEAIVEYINLPRKLQPAEQTHVDNHTTLGHDYLMALAIEHDLDTESKAFVEKVAAFALYHHNPLACQDVTIRPFIELLHLLDRGLGWTDINRAYQVAKGIILSPQEAIPNVVYAMEAVDDRLVIHLPSVEGLSVKGIQNVRKGRVSVE